MNIGIFANFKYVNFQILFITALSGLAIITIYSDSKLFTVVSIMIITIIDVIIIAMVKPYKYGFVSCFKDDDNKTERMF